MLRRIFAFILGMIFGMILLVGGLVGGVYYVATSVPPAQLAPETQTYLGDLANMPLMDMVTHLQQLYNEKLGLVDENGQYYSLGSFCAEYHIDTNAAFGVQLPQDVLDIPLFEFFNENTDAEGLTGVRRAMKQIKVSAVPSIVNLFSTPDEEGNPVVNQSVMDELSNYNLDELMDETLGVSYVFQNIKLADLLPDAFPAEDSNNAIMWAVGQSMLGKLIAAFSSSDSLYTQFAENGAFGSLGALKVTELLGGGDELLQSMLGDTLLRQMINEEGSVSFEGLLDTLYLGNILCYKRSAVANTNGYTPVFEDNSVMQNGENYIRADANGNYWTASACTEEHTHTQSCYKFNWYTDVECTQPVEGIYSGLVNIGVGDLMSGSTDAIMDELMNLQISDIVNGELTGILANFADLSIGELMNGGLDGLYIGGFLGFARTAATAPESHFAVYANEQVVAYVGQNGSQYVMSDNGTDWYNAKVICTDDDGHTNRSCYSYVWKNGETQPEGIMSIFADKKVSDLSNIESELMKLTLRDVLGDEQLQSGILKDLADVEIGKLTEVINTLYIGGVMGFIRNETETDGYTESGIANILSKTVDENTLYVREHDGKYYEAEFSCTDESADHTHTASCFDFVWYQATVTTNSENYAATDLVLADGHHARVDGLYAALVNITIADLTSGSADMLLDKIKDLKIRDIVNGEINGILESFADMTVNDLLNGGIDQLYIGSFLGFARTAATAPESQFAVYAKEQVVAYVGQNGSQYVMSDNGTDWYNAKVICTDDDGHTNRSCYSYIWKNGETQPEGVMAIFADKKVNELNNIENDLMKLTLRDVLGDEQLQSGILKDLADVEIGKLTEVIDTLYLGSVMGFIRNETETDGYTESGIANILSKTVDENTLYVREHDGKHYEAEFSCTDESAEHTHTASCYNFVWYQATVTTNSEDYAATDLVLADGHHARVDGLYSALVNLTIQDLTNGSSDKILDCIKELKISEIVNGEISGVMANFADMTVNDLLNGGIDNLYLGNILGYGRTTATAPDGYTELLDGEAVVAYVNVSGSTVLMSENATEWFEAKRTCEQMHEHNRSCYCYIWKDGETPVTGVMGKLADKKISQLDNLSDTVTSLTLREVLGDSGVESGLLSELADIPIGEITNQINSMHLGSVFGNIRHQIDEYGFETVAGTEDILTNGSIFAKEFEGAYYEAALTCAESHTHTDSCYGYVWYNAEVTTDSANYAETDLVLEDGHHAKATGIQAALSNVVLSDLMSGSTDTILKSIEHMTLDEVTNGGIAGIMANFSDMTMYELMHSGIDGLYLGGFMRFDRIENVAPSSATELHIGENVVAYVGEVDEQIVMSDDNKTWFDAKCVCQQEHTHERSCYSYIWYDGSQPATGIMATLADKKMSEVNNISSIVQELTLRDVLDAEQLESGILAELADVPLSDISTKINTLYLGSVMNGIRNNIADIDGYTAVDGAEGVFTNSTMFAKADGETYYQAELTCTNESAEHTHNASCYEFVWYNATPIEGAHTHSESELVLDDKHYERLTGINKALANLVLDDISGSSDVLFNKIKKLTVAELAGGEIGGIMENLKDMTIDQLLNGGVETMYFGTFMHYSRLPVEGLPTGVTQFTKDGQTVASVGTIGGILVMSDKEDGEIWYKAKLVCKDAEHSHDRNCYIYLWDDEDGVPSKGMMEKLANKKVGDLEDMNESISSFTVEEVLGGNLVGVLKCVKDVPLKDLDEEIDRLYLGSVLDYYRLTVDTTTYTAVGALTDVKTNGTLFAKTDNGTDWYLAELDCTNVSAEHTHSASCYTYIWYTDENCTTPVSGVQKAFANGTLNDIGSTMDNLTLGKLGIGGNNILDSLQDVPLADIGSEINNMQLGVVFGFVLVGDDWYQPCESDCTHSESEHTLEGHDGHFTKANGINGKMANKTMSELASGNGLTDVVAELTVGELIDSGMMSLGDTESDKTENGYKFAIIFCDCDCESITETIPFIGTKTYGCNLPDFLIYKSTHSDETASSYYGRFTHDEGCKDSWRSLKLSEFVTTLLSAIN